MIDFPASPVDGQIFSATNGVVYRWSATSSAWLAQTPPPVLGGTGDFFAGGNPAASFGNTIIVVAPPTVNSGNAGGWYNAGGYTPPAGRFTLFGYVTMVATSAIGQGGLYLYKNGVQIPNVTTSASTPVGAAVPIFLQTTVDANGTDVFTLRTNCSVAATLYSIGFGAFPLTGIQGPQGPLPAGALSLYSEQRAVGGETGLSVTIPLNAKRVQVQVSSTAAAGDPNLYLQTVESGVINASNNHRIQKVYGQSTTVGASQSTTSTAWDVGGTNSSACVLELMPWGSVWRGTVILHMASSGGALYVQNYAIDGGANSATTTGFRVGLSTSTFVAGSFMRAYVVP